MKKIWLLCLCLASLSLVGCFHVPDEDWLPNKNNVSSREEKKDVEFKQAVDSFMDGVNMISSDWKELKNEKNGEITDEEVEDIEVEGGIINNEEIIDEEVENLEVENKEIENEVDSEE